MADDWYRRKTWTPKDREEFLTRLHRCRSEYNKAQYARIQAYELLITRKREAYLAALELLDMVLAEWPDEESQLAALYQHRADCFSGLDDFPRAIDAYRQAFQTQRVHNRYLTNAHVDFGWLVATTPLPELYDEALAVLCEFRRDMFPIDRYRANAIQALILDAQGKHEQARSYASLAIEAAAATHSGFRYHAKLGLVRSPERQVHERLQLLAA